MRVHATQDRTYLQPETEDEIDTLEWFTGEVGWWTADVDDTPLPDPLGTEAERVFVLPDEPLSDGSGLVSRARSILGYWLPPAVALVNFVAALSILDEWLER